MPIEAARKPRKRKLRKTSAKIVAKTRKAFDAWLRAELARPGLAGPGPEHKEAWEDERYGHGWKMCLDCGGLWDGDGKPVTLGDGFCEQEEERTRRRSVQGPIPPGRK